MKELLKGNGFIERKLFWKDFKSIFILILLLLIIFIPEGKIIGEQIIILNYEKKGQELNIDIYMGRERYNKILQFDYEKAFKESEMIITILNKNKFTISDMLSLDNLLENMHRRFISPIELFISRDSNVCFILGDEFKYFPFHIFKNKGEYLIEKYYVFYGLNMEQIKNISKEPVLKYPQKEDNKSNIYSDKLGKKILENINVFGIPAISEGSSYKQLEVALQNTEILYITTHGKLDKEKKKYWLNLGSEHIDINNLNYNNYKTKQIFVNACESSSGFIFPQKCYQLGIKSFIGSQWKHLSKDRATANVISRFYKNWMEGNSLVKSLGYAQRETLRKERIANENYKDKYRKNGDFPYYWAQFVLIGDWR